MRSNSLRQLISVMVPALVLGGLAYLIIPVLSIVILISVPLLMHSKRKSDQEKLKHANVVQWPTIMEHLAANIESGLSLQQGLIRTGGRYELLRTVAEKLAFGIGLETSTQSLDHDVYGQRIRHLILLAQKVGSDNLPDLLRLNARFLRRELEVMEEVKVRQSWVTSGARLGLTAPWIVLLLLSLRSSTREVYATLTGSLIILVGFLITVFAWLWMLRLQKSSLSLEVK